MPLREYRCPEHGRFTELFSGSEYPEYIRCPECGTVSKHVFSAANWRFDFRDGWDPGVGRHFGTARERDTFLEEHGLEKAPDGAFGTEGADVRR